MKKAITGKHFKILAIESSCDETAAAVISTENLELRSEGFEDSKISALRNAKCEMRDPTYLISHLLILKFSPMSFLLKLIFTKNLAEFFPRSPQEPIPNK